MLPLLRILADEREHSLQETVDRISDEFQLSSEERRQLLPIGNQEVIRNRIGWARTYLGKAGLSKPTEEDSLKLPARPRCFEAEPRYHQCQIPGAIP
ncbi:MAG: winged helix-turn-helix domain-containing protein [Deltaproteobacteria bacterium]|nr:winged helix-turn-helix domain-containing protein [Deltaproteobacteria bacterium]